MYSFGHTPKISNLSLHFVWGQFIFVISCFCHTYSRTYTILYRVIFNEYDPLKHNLTY